jgi:competence protein ComGC
MLSPIVSRSLPRRQGVTLIEVLLVMGMIGWLLGLALPAIQNSHEAANRLVCQDHLKQIGVALHLSDAVHGFMPPAIGYYPAGGAQAYGTVWLHLLPFLQENALYNQAAGADGQILPPYPNVAATPIKQFQCPSDPSLGAGVLLDPQNTQWGANNYAINAQVFCIVYPYSGPWGGWYWDAAGHPSLASTFSDGASNTILVAEKYSQCSNMAFSEGGSAWAYYFTTELNTKPYHAGFSITWTSYDIDAGSRFLVRPSPYTGPESRCDPTLASTAHSSMPVLMGDGSVRSLAAGMSGDTWWAACTPNARDLLGSDWW